MNPYDLGPETGSSHLRTAGTRGRSCGPRRERRGGRHLEGASAGRGVRPARHACLFIIRSAEPAPAQLPLTSRSYLRRLDTSPAGAAGSDPRRDSPGPRALAFWCRAQRLRRRRPALRARKALTRGGRRGLAEHRVPHTARQDTADHRRADRVGADSRDRRAGSEDRDRRRRNRPDAPVLRTGRVRISAPAFRRVRPRIRRRR